MKLLTLLPVLMGRFALGVGMIVSSSLISNVQALTLHLHCPASYVEGIPLLARVELRHADGTMAREVWNAEAVLSTSDSQVSLSTNRVRLVNGLGSALVIPVGSRDFNLMASVGELQATRPLTRLNGDPNTIVSGTLPGSQTTWSGVVHVTGDVTIPPGHTLTIVSNTLVLLDGVASGSGGADLFVQGKLECLGTADDPVTLTCSDPALNWGQIRHENAEPSRYNYTFIHKAGAAPGEGHTGTAPALRLTGSTVTLAHCVVSDLVAGGKAIGKTMQASGGSDITFQDCLLTRSRMGPEITGTALLCTNTWITHMFGVDDDDGIYIHTQAAGQQALLTGCVVAFTDDDGIDTLGSEITATNCLIRDVFDKGMSIFHNEVRVWRCLIIDCGKGISTKTSNDRTVRTRINQCTIRGRERGIAAENKNGGSPRATVLYAVTNSIILATGIPNNAIYTDYDPTNIEVVYSDIVGKVWPGVGNILADPAFVNPDQYDFHLQPGSPGIDAGDPAAPGDPDGSRADLGYFRFLPPPPVLAQPQVLPDGNMQFGLRAYTNRDYRLEYSPDFRTWQSLVTVFATNPVTLIRDLAATNAALRVYRARLGP